MKKIIILSIVSLSLLAARTSIQKPSIANNEPLGWHWCRYHPGVCSIFGAPKTPTQPPPPLH